MKKHFFKNKTLVFRIRLTRNLKCIFDLIYTDIKH